MEKIMVISFTSVKKVCSTISYLKYNLNIKIINIDVTGRLDHLTPTIGQYT